MNWFVTQKITGRIIDDWVANDERRDLTRGDICKIGDDYYVFDDGGSTGRNPVFSPGQWYKLP